MLSFAGRKILVGHVLSSLATHIAIVFPLPKSVTNHMKCLMRNFLWSAETIRSRRNQISWDVVCLRTKEGGLGIRHIHEQNEASFLKLGWMAASSRSLLADWMTCRYFPKWSSSTTKSGSCILRKIGKLATHIKFGRRWIIGNGKLVDIWFDSWADKLALLPNFPQSPSPSIKR